MISVSSITPHSITNSDELRTQMGAVRLSVHWLGTSKTLPASQQAEAAATFGASREYLSARKKLIDTRHPAYRQVSSIRTRIVSLWKGMTVPYPDPGIRLIRRDRIEVFESEVQQLQEELQTAVEQLEREFGELKMIARQRLGELFNEEDYPNRLENLFRIEVEYPNVEPPNYLQRLNPEVYEEECRRIEARFEEALELAEESFLQEFQQLVTHLSERLSGETDGRPKVFRDSALTNLTEFLQRFRQLNIRSNAQLEELIDEVQEVTSGLSAHHLRSDRTVRETVRGQLEQVGEVLSDQLELRPRRQIVRSHSREEVTSDAT
ncbi:hypothetical protein Pla110_43880 [Polystyrenella longa]|uniref:DUF3150 domain-containing protein n=1 Tax=Polystyrenella longa TaxID=2528007 RepID=A0A518CTR8_9PLAN|nr:hypothetical protein [Polystyrenella longa]QDU82627.1 hypothetical protein Pla110_43880 [Polystyrenella longa]